MPRYVILEHTGTPAYKPGRHWDLMLEEDGRLRTWDLEAAPSRGVSIRAFALPDHRLDYLHYEGPVGNDRGIVRQWGAGQYVLLSETASQIKVQLNGQQLHGRLTLDRDPVEAGTWHAFFVGP